MTVQQRRPKEVWQWQGYEKLSIHTLVPAGSATFRQSRIQRCLRSGCRPANLYSRRR